MNENLNLVEILKDCPVGTKLYSTIYGDVEFVKVSNRLEYPIEVKRRFNSIGSFTNDGRAFAGYDGECTLFPSKDQRDWSKFKVKSNKPKFDPMTLQPFDKVLGRDEDNEKWNCGFFSHKNEFNNAYPYRCVGSPYTYCIPYNEDTWHLIGTADEAPEFYRYWEE